MINPFACISLLSSAIIFSLGNFVFFEGRKEKLNTVFLLLCLTEALWAFGEYEVLSASLGEDAFVWNKLGIVWPFIFAFCLHFMLLFSGREKLLERRASYLLIYLPAFFFLVLELSTNLMTGEFVRAYWGWKARIPRNPFTAAATTWVALTAVLSTFLLLRDAFKAPDPRRRRQAAIICAGFLSFYAVTLATEVILPLFWYPFPRMSSFALMIKSAFISYAIGKHQLFTLTSKNVSESILSAISDALLLVNDEGRIQAVNRAFLDVCGYREGEVLGRKLEEFLKDGAGFDGEDFTDREAVFKAKDGGSVPVSLSRSMLGAKKGSHHGAVYAGRDITERKRAHAELQRQMAYLEGLYMNAPEAIVICDNEGKIFRVNPEFSRMFGYALDQVVGLHVDDLIVQCDSVEEARKLTEETISGSSVCLEAVRRRRDGSPIYVSLFGTPIMQGESQLGVYVIYRDITERKKVEEALKESERQYRLLFECAGDLIVIHSIDGRILEANERALWGLGYTRTEMLEKHLNDIVVQEKHGGLELLQNQVRREGSVVFESAGIAKDGSRIPVEINSRLITYKGEQACLSIVRDLTERRTAEKALKETEERLLHSQKMEAIGRLAGGVAHDFNNLLTAISGFSEIILMKDSTCEETRKYLMEIKNSTERAASLTRQLLAFSRKQVMQPKILDLNKLITDVSRLLRRLIGEDIDLVNILDQGLGKVRADPAQMEQVLINLAVNSRDAMPEGGRIVIETRNEELDRKRSALGDDIGSGSFVTLSVSDTGHGMDEETRLRIFEPFFTTKAPGKGTGLGLSTVFGIVKQSGGYISASSEPGKGATMKVYLPRVDVREAAFEGEGEHGKVKQGHETILVVEDEEIVRTMLCRMLKSLGYTIYEAKSVYEALGIAESNGEKRIDLMITDVVMPGMNGRELASLLTRTRPGTRVLYISGYTDESIVPHGVLDSGVHFLQKPFNSKTLAQKVREVLEESLEEKAG